MWVSKFLCLLLSFWLPVLRRLTLRLHVCFYLLLHVCFYLLSQSCADSSGGRCRLEVLLLVRSIDPPHDVLVEVLWVGELGTLRSFFELVADVDLRRFFVGNFW